MKSSYGHFSKANFLCMDFLASALFFAAHPGKAMGARSRTILFPQASIPSSRPLHDCNHCSVSFTDALTKRFDTASAAFLNYPQSMRMPTGSEVEKILQ